MHPLEPTPSSVDALLSHPRFARSAASLELGVATSAFQTEGSLDLPGHPRSNWLRWQREGKVEPIGLACELWERFDEVVSRVDAMGLRLFRMSLEWPRLCPDGESLSPFAVEGYAARIASLRERGIEPLLTLCHFTHPEWAGEDLWLDRESPCLFARYCRRAMKAIGRAMVSRGVRPPTRLLTLNEANMLALASWLAGVFPHRAKAVSEGDPRGLLRTVRALDHLFAGHVLATRALRDLYEREAWGAPDVSTNVNLVDLYSLAKLPLDVLRAPALGVRPRQLGQHLSRSQRRFARDLFGDDPRGDRARVARTADALLSRVIGYESLERTASLVYDDGHRGRDTLDHLAIDVYDPFTAHQIAATPGLVRALADGDLGAARGALARGVTLAEPWDWVVDPESLVRGVRAMSAGAEGVPLDIDECGMAVERHDESGPAVTRSDGLRRPTFLRAMITAALRAKVIEGLPLRAWCAWTLVDNYELGRWAPRFGIFAREPTDDGGVRWAAHDAAEDDSAATLAGISGALSLLADVPPLACTKLRRALVVG